MSAPVLTSLDSVQLTPMETTLLNVVRSAPKTQLGEQEEQNPLFCCSFKDKSAEIKALLNKLVKAGVIETYQTSPRPASLDGGGEAKLIHKETGELYPDSLIIVMSASSFENIGCDLTKEQAH